MPYCAKCQNWAYPYESVCSHCGNIFGWSIPKQDIPYESNNLDNSGENNQSNVENEQGNISGAVYLIKSGEFYKIGKTINYKRRYPEIKLQLPFDTEEVHIILTNNINFLEKHWHLRFKNKRKNGEWFKLSDKDVEEFISMQEVIYNK